MWAISLGSTDSADPGRGDVVDATSRHPHMMRTALRLASRGMHVFPLWPGTKRPAVRSDWEGVATTNPEAIFRWWDRAPFNIGIATGPSQLVVVDLDAPKVRPAPHGRQALIALARSVGETIPRQTLTVVTPGGGQHLYFRAPDGEVVRSTVGRLGHNIDTRGAGGYIVGPSSVVNYRRYRLVRDVAPAPLPSWIMDGLRPAPIRMVPGSSVPRAAYDAQAVLRRAVEDVELARTGTRNHTLFKAAARLSRLVGDGRLTEAEVRSALERASAAHLGVDGFSSAEVARTIMSGLRSRGSESPPVRTDTARRGVVR